MIPLPVDPYVPRVREALRVHRAAVVVAAPGAGKTTRIPPALAADGPAILLQPRRVAARSIARRIAWEQQWTLGADVGWHVRFERQFSAGTKLLVATEGILTARLQQDPLLSAFTTVILDEFHERSIHADVGLALARQAWAARDDLGIVVMSATLDAARVSAYLDGCPVLEVPGMLHPVEVRYRRDAAVADGVADALGHTPGDVLCFLPGARDVRDAAEQVRTRLGGTIDVLQLHGGLTAEEQDAVLRAPRAVEGAGDESLRRRVIVATNLAETSLTVPGVRAVIDSGLHKVARYDPARGVDSLELERSTRDSAEKRAGRA